MRFPRATQSNAGWSRLDRTLFCVLAGVVSTFASGYTYGEVNQVEHLPQIFRALDAEYLTGDFFVNAGDTFSPRVYYVWLMAALGAWIPLPVLFVALTCLANAAVAAVTYYIARRMSRDDDLTAALACCTVLAVNGFNAGSATHIPQAFLEPALLARPLAMLGLWWTIKGEAARPAGLFVAAIALHPLVGPETAAVAVAAAGVALLVEMRRPRDLWPLLTGARARRLLIVAMVCVVTTAVFWGRGYVRTLGTEQFIQILAYTRTPHHYIPSLFAAGHHLAFAVFCLAAALSWTKWRVRAPDRHVAHAVLAVGGVVLLGCVGGYVFVELWPTRGWTTAQTFRLTYLIKWFAFLLFALEASRALRSDRPVAERLSGSLLVLGVGRYQPAIALMGTIGVEAGRLLGAARGATATALAAGSVLIAVVLVGTGTTSYPDEPFVLALLLAIAVWFVLVPSARWRRAVPAVAISAAVLLFVGFRSSPVVLQAARSVSLAAPRMTLSESAKVWTTAAWFARAKTPRDAVFLVPPPMGLGGFRLISERAVVVDSKVHPFGDAGLAEWYERMLFAYAGRLDSAPPPNFTWLDRRRRGVHGVGDRLDRDYASIADDHLVRIQRRYGATHALLWSPTATEMPVLYEDQAYKIVRIEVR